MTAQKAEVSQQARADGGPLEESKGETSRLLTAFGSLELGEDPRPSTSRSPGGAAAVATSHLPSMSEGYSRSPLYAATYAMGPDSASMASPSYPSSSPQIQPSPTGFPSPPAFRIQLPARSPVDQGSDVAAATSSPAFRIQLPARSPTADFSPSSAVPDRGGVRGGNTPDE